MNKEEIEELKDFTIDITDIDELALGLEVCSKKSNMIIQEFADLIIELQKQNQKYKEVIDRVISILMNADTFRNYDNEEDDTKYTNIDVDELIDILNGADKEVE